jgi:NMD protein affecting ribosome stability and mRNA decay
MNCPHCGYPNPNGYEGLCKSCRKPLATAPVTVAKKTQEVVEKPKKVATKSTGKAGTKKSAKK